MHQHNYTLLDALFNFIQGRFNGTLPTDKKEVNEIVEAVAIGEGADVWDYYMKLPDSGYDVLVKDLKKSLKRGKLSITETITRNCDYCGKEYIPERPKSRFHNDSCRRDWHRARKREKKQYNATLVLLETLREQINANNAFEIVTMIKTIQEKAEAIIRENDKSVWHCINCSKIMYRLPKANDCNCGDKANWKLQKKLF